MAFLRFIRFPNLFIVALTQYLLQYIVISPSYKANGIEKALDDFHFFLLVLATISITISGYIINDILDYDLDLVNKPDKVIVNKYISVQNAFRLYHFINLTGFGISLYLAFHIQNIPLVLIYPAAIYLLFVYSKHLKKRAIWGNLIVAIFCAFVAGIVLFAERDGFFQLTGKAFQIVNVIFVAYFVFAFLSTFYREIIKDIEDFTGDQSKGFETLPIKFGVPFAKSVALSFGVGLLLLIVWWMFLQITFFNSINLFIAVFILIFIPVFISLIVLKRANSKQDFSNSSKLAKYIMVSGLIYLLFLI